MESVWKEAAAALFEVLYRRMVGGTGPRKPCQSSGSCGLNRGTCEYEAGVVVAVVVVVLVVQVVVVVVHRDVWRMNAEQFKIPRETGNSHVKVFYHHEAPRKLSISCSGQDKKGAVKLLPVLCLLFPQIFYS
jgi:hypothetical protein